MAGNIKGITIEFQGDTTRLDRALRQINNNTKSLDRELKQVDKALKFNPTSVELWRQKQDLLTQKIAETKSKLDTLKQAQAQMDADGVDKNSEEYRKLQREIIVTENQVKTFEGQLRKIGNVNLRATSEQFKEMGNKLTNAGQAMMGLSTAAAAVTAAIGAAAVKSGAWADDLNTMSKIYGINTTELQKYSAAADLVDVSVEDIAKSHIKLEKSMYAAQTGSASAATAFDQLGVSYTNADGSLRDADTVWQEAISALGSMSNETERDAIAMQLMGKSAANLNPLIEDSGETYKMVADTMAKYGLEYVDQDTLNKANQFNDSLDTMKLLATTAFNQMATQLSAYLAPAMQRVVDIVGQLAQWFSQLSPQTQTIIVAITGVVAVLGPLLIGLGKISFAISSIMSLMSVIGPAIGGVLTALGPVVLIIGALVAAGVLLYKNWDTIKAKAVELWTNVTTTWQSIKESIRATIAQLVSNTVGKFNSLKTSVETAWNNIKSAMINPIQTARDTLQGIIDKVKSWFPINLGNIFNFKLPHINIGSKSVTVGDKTVTVPTFSVSWYARGGIFDQPTLAGIGEAGPEAVVPLDRFWEEIRNSNATTDRILAQHTQILSAILEELEKEKNFKVNGMWAGRYVNSMVKGRGW